MLVPADGGEPRPLTELDSARHERTHRWPAFLPDGKSVLFTVGTTDSPGAYDDSRIDVVDLASGERHTLLEGASYARVSEDGHLFFGRDRTVFVMRLADADGGPPRSAQVFRGDVASLPASGVFFFELARDGTVVYAVEDPNSGQFELAWVDEHGEFQPAGFPVDEYLVPRLSPDGSSVAVTIGPGRGRGGDIYIGDLATGALRRLTFDERSTYPLWTPDGTRVAFAYGVETGGSVRECFGWKAADGSDETEVLVDFQDSVPRAPCSFTPDGTKLLFLQDGGPGHSSDILYADLESGEIHPVATEAFVEWGAQLSPDGRHMAYQSDESGVSVVYVTTFPELQGRWQLSSLGQAPRWTPDGTGIEFTANGIVMRSAVEATPSFRFEQPTERFPLRFQAWIDTFTNFDVAADGRLLVLRSPSGDSRETRLHVILNALEGL